MAMNKAALSPQLKALKTTDLTPLIGMAGLMLPRTLGGFLPCLDKKQRSAFDKVMPMGGSKKFYLQLVGTPTPPIVIGLAQPPKISTLPEREVARQQIKGIRLTIGDLQLLSDTQILGNRLRLLWRLKGQIFTILSIGWLFAPFLWLGPAEIKDMINKANTRSKPLLDLLPRPKK